MKASVVELEVPDLPADWDYVCKTNPDATYGHTREWLSLLARHFETEPMALACESHGEIVGVYPGFLKRKFSGRGRLTTSLLGALKVLWSPLDDTWDYGGPVGDQESISALIKSMEHHAKQRRAAEVRVSPWSAKIGSELGRQGYRPLLRQSSVVSLESNLDVVWEALAKSFRNAVRRAERGGVHVASATDARLIKSAYGCLRGVAERKEFTIPPLAFFEDAIDSQKEVRYRTYLASMDDRPVAGAFVIEYCGTATTRWWGSLRRPSLPPSGNLLLWHILRESLERGLRCCDLGGLPAPSSNGVRRFKLSLGGEIVSTPWYVRDLILRRTRSEIRTVRRHVRSASDTLPR